MIKLDCAEQRILSLPRLSSSISEIISIMDELKLDFTDLEAYLRQIDEEYVETCFADLNVVARRCNWYISHIQSSGFVADQVLKLFRQLPKVCYIIGI